VFSSCAAVVFRGMFVCICRLYYFAIGPQAVINFSLIGLRWYNDESIKALSCVCICTTRLWFVYNTDSNKSTSPSTAGPTEIGYMNVIPKCISSLSKYPHYENLPETYVAINDYLLESPLEGLVEAIDCNKLGLTGLITGQLRHLSDLCKISREPLQ